ncbi:pentapeptide repeat-containing protein [Streptomyces sp. NPDC000878]
MSCGTIRDIANIEKPHRSWQGCDLDLTGVTIDGNMDFTGATFSGGAVNFGGAVFSDGMVAFGDATFSGGAVSFDRATGSIPQLR